MTTEPSEYTGKILCGDALEKLRTLPDCSAHCCVTSPPYWGLRDYGCEGQMGLEPTPEAYVARMVEVFREVKRVLRDDGTLWLNVGSSYASRDIPASQSPRNEHAPACDSDGIEPADSPCPDCACPDHCDARQDDSCSRRRHTTRTGQRSSQDEPLPSPTGHDSEHQDYAEASCLAVLDDALVSTTLSLPENVPVAYAREGAVWADQQSCQTLPCDARPSEHMGQSTGGTSSLQQTSEIHTQGTAPSSAASGPPPDIEAHCTTFCSGLQFKQKDLVPIPWLLAIALQQDGWYLRSDIIWAKGCSFGPYVGNPMPESVTDRPTKSHEHVFLLTKRARYYFDADAVREANATVASTRDAIVDWKNRPNNGATDGKGLGCYRMGSVHNGRNIRDVWTIPTSPCPEAHFAVMPPRLVEPCIKAGTSERGCCQECGAPWRRVVERKTAAAGQAPGYARDCTKRNDGDRAGSWVDATSTTIGWQPTCTCDAGEPVPCTALDPFFGAGTVGLVAQGLGRRFVGIELNPEYVAIAERRIAEARRKHQPTLKLLEAPA